MAFEQSGETLLDRVWEAALEGERLVEKEKDEESLKYYNQLVRYHKERNYEALNRLIEEGYKSSDDRHYALVYWIQKNLLNPHYIDIPEYARLSGEVYERGARSTISPEQALQLFQEGSRKTKYNVGDSEGTTLVELSPDMVQTLIEAGYLAAVRNAATGVWGIVATDKWADPTLQKPGKAIAPIAIIGGVKVVGKPLVYTTSALLEKGLQEIARRRELAQEEPAGLTPSYAVSKAGLLPPTPQEEAQIGVPLKFRSRDKTLHVERNRAINFLEGIGRGVGRGVKDIVKGAQVLLRGITSGDLGGAMAEYAQEERREAEENLLSDAIMSTPGWERAVGEMAGYLLPSLITATAGGGLGAQLAARGTQVFPLLTKSPGVARVVQMAARGIGMGAGATAGGLPQTVASISREAGEGGEKVTGEELEERLKERVAFVDLPSNVLGSLIFLGLVGRVARKQWEQIRSIVNRSEDFPQALQELQRAKLLPTQSPEYRHLERLARQLGEVDDPGKLVAVLSEPSNNKALFDTIRGAARVLRSQGKESVAQLLDEIAGISKRYGPIFRYTLANAAAQAMVATGFEVGYLLFNTDRRPSPEEVIIQFATNFALSLLDVTDFMGESVPRLASSMLLAPNLLQHTLEVRGEQLHQSLLETDAKLLGSAQQNLEKLAQAINALQEQYLGQTRPSGEAAISGAPVTAPEPPVSGAPIAAPEPPVSGAPVTVSEPQTIPSPGPAAPAEAPPISTPPQEAVPVAGFPTAGPVPPQAPVATQTPEDRKRAEIADTLGSISGLIRWASGEINKLPAPQTLEDIENTAPQRQQIALALSLANLGINQLREKIAGTPEQELLEGGLSRLQEGVNYLQGQLAEYSLSEFVPRLSTFLRAEYPEKFVRETLQPLAQEFARLRGKAARELGLTTPEEAEPPRQVAEEIPTPSEPQKAEERPILGSEELRERYLSAIRERLESQQQAEAYGYVTKEFPPEHIEPLEQAYKKAEQYTRDVEKEKKDVLQFIVEKLDESEGRKREEATRGLTFAIYEPRTVLKRLQQLVPSKPFRKEEGKTKYQITREDANRLTSALPLIILFSNYTASQGDAATSNVNRQTQQLLAHALLLSYMHNLRESIKLSDKDDLLGAIYSKITLTDVVNGQEGGLRAIAQLVQRLYESGRVGVAERKYREAEKVGKEDLWRGAGVVTEVAGRRGSESQESVYAALDALTKILGGDYDRSLQNLITRHLLEALEVPFQLSEHSDVAPNDVLEAILNGIRRRQSELELELGGEFIRASSQGLAKKFVDYANKYGIPLQLLADIQGRIPGRRLKSDELEKVLNALKRVTRGEWIEALQLEEGWGPQQLESALSQLSHPYPMTTAGSSTRIREEFRNARLGDGSYSEPLISTLVSHAISVLDSAPQGQESSGADAAAKLLTLALILRRDVGGRQERLKEWLAPYEEEAGERVEQRISIVLNRIENLMSSLKDARAIQDFVDAGLIAMALWERGDIKFSREPDWDSENMKKLARRISSVISTDASFVADEGTSFSAAAIALLLDRGSSRLMERLAEFAEFLYPQLNSIRARGNIEGLLRRYTWWAQNVAARIYQHGGSITYLREAIQEPQKGHYIGLLNLLTEYSAGDWKQRGEELFRLLSAYDPSFQPQLLWWLREELLKGDSSKIAHWRGSDLGDTLIKPLIPPQGARYSSDTIAGAYQRVRETVAKGEGEKYNFLADLWGALVGHELLQHWARERPAVSVELARGILAPFWVNATTAIVTESISSLTPISSPLDEVGEGGGNLWEDIVGYVKDIEGQSKTISGAYRDEDKLREGASALIRMLEWYFGYRELWEGSEPKAREYALRSGITLRVRESIIDAVDSLQRELEKQTDIKRVNNRVEELRKQISHSGGVSKAGEIWLPLAERILHQAGTILELREEKLGEKVGVIISFVEDIKLAARALSKWNSLEYGEPQTQARDLSVAGLLIGSALSSPRTQKHIAEALDRVEDLLKRAKKEPSHADLAERVLALLEHTRKRFGEELKRAISNKARLTERFIDWIIAEKELGKRGIKTFREVAPLANPITRGENAFSLLRREVEKVEKEVGVGWGRDWKLASSLMESPILAGKYFSLKGDIVVAYDPERGLRYFMREEGVGADGGKLDYYMEIDYDSSTPWTLFIQHKVNTEDLLNLRAELIPFELFMARLLRKHIRSIDPSTDLQERLHYLTRDKLVEFLAPLFQQPPRGAAVVEHNGEVFVYPARPISEDKIEVYEPRGIRIYSRDSVKYIENGVPLRIRGDKQGAVLFQGDVIAYYQLRNGKLEETKYLVVDVESREAVRGDEAKRRIFVIPYEHLERIVSWAIRYLAGKGGVDLSRLRGKELLRRATPTNFLYFYTKLLSRVVRGADKGALEEIRDIGQVLGEEELRVDLPEEVLKGAKDIDEEELPSLEELREGMQEWVETYLGDFPEGVEEVREEEERKKPRRKLDFSQILKSLVRTIPLGNAFRAVDITAGEIWELGGKYVSSVAPRTRSEQLLGLSDFIRAAMRVADVSIVENILPSYPPFDWRLEQYSPGQLVSLTPVLPHKQHQDRYTALVEAISGVIKGDGSIDWEKLAASHHLPLFLTLFAVASVRYPRHSAILRALNREDNVTVGEGEYNLLEILLDTARFIAAGRLGLMIAGEGEALAAILDSLEDPLAVEGIIENYPELLAGYRFLEDILFTKGNPALTSDRTLQTYYLERAEGWRQEGREALDALRQIFPEGVEPYINAALADISPDVVRGIRRGAERRREELGVPQDIPLLTLSEIHELGVHVPYTALRILQDIISGEKQIEPLEDAGRAAVVRNILQAAEQTKPSQGEHLVHLLGGFYATPENVSHISASRPFFARVLQSAELYNLGLSGIRARLPQVTITGNLIKAEESKPQNISVLNYLSILEGLARLSDPDSAQALQKHYRNPDTFRALVAALGGDNADALAQLGAASSIAPEYEDSIATLLEFITTASHSLTPADLYSSLYLMWTTYMTGVSNPRLAGELADILHDSISRLPPEKQRELETMAANRLTMLTLMPRKAIYDNPEWLLFQLARLGRDTGRFLLRLLEADDEARRVLERIQNTWEALPRELSWEDVTVSPEELKEQELGEEEWGGEAGGGGLLKDQYTVMTRAVEAIRYYSAALAVKKSPVNIQRILTEGTKLIAGRSKDFIEQVMKAIKFPQDTKRERARRILEEYARQEYGEGRAPTIYSTPLYEGLKNIDSILGQIAEKAEAGDDFWKDIHDELKAIRLKVEELVLELGQLSSVLEAHNLYLSTPSRKPGEPGVGYEDMAYILLNVGRFKEAVVLQTLAGASHIISWLPEFVNWMATVKSTNSELARAIQGSLIEVIRRTRGFLFQLPEVKWKTTEERTATSIAQLMAITRGTPAAINTLIKAAKEPSDMLSQLILYSAPLAGEQMAVVPPGLGGELAGLFQSMGAEPRQAASIATRVGEFATRVAEHWGRVSRQIAESIEMLRKAAGEASEDPHAAEVMGRMANRLDTLASTLVDLSRNAVLQLEGQITAFDSQISRIDSEREGEKLDRVLREFLFDRLLPGITSTTTILTSYLNTMVKELEVEKRALSAIKDKKWAAEALELLGNMEKAIGEQVKYDVVQPEGENIAYKIASQFFDLQMNFWTTIGSAIESAISQMPQKTEAGTLFWGLFALSLARTKPEEVVRRFLTTYRRLNSWGVVIGPEPRGRKQKSDMYFVSPHEVEKLVTLILKVYETINGARQISERYRLWLLDMPPSASVPILEAGGEQEAPGGAVSFPNTVVLDSAANRDKAARRHTITTFRGLRGETSLEIEEILAHLFSNALGVRDSELPAISELRETIKNVVGERAILTGILIERVEDALKYNIALILSPLEENISWGDTFLVPLGQVVFQSWERGGWEFISFGDLKGEPDWSAISDRVPAQLVNYFTHRSIISQGRIASQILERYESLGWGEAVKQLQRHPEIVVVYSRPLEERISEPRLIHADFAMMEGFWQVAQMITQEERQKHRKTGEVSAIIAQPLENAIRAEMEYYPNTLISEIALREGSLLELWGKSTISSGTIAQLGSLPVVGTQYDPDSWERGGLDRPLEEVAKQVKKGAIEVIEFYREKVGDKRIQELREKINSLMDFPERGWKRGYIESLGRALGRAREFWEGVLREGEKLKSENPIPPIKELIRYYEAPVEALLNVAQDIVSRFVEAASRAELRAKDMNRVLREAARGAIDQYVRKLESVGFEKVVANGKLLGAPQYRGYYIIVNEGKSPVDLAKIRGAISPIVLEAHEKRALWLWPIDVTSIVELALASGPRFRLRSVLAATVEYNALLNGSRLSPAGEDRLEDYLIERARAVALRYAHRYPSPVWERDPGGVLAKLLREDMGELNNPEMYSLAFPILAYLAAGGEEEEEEEEGSETLAGVGNWLLGALLVAFLGRRVFRMLKRRAHAPQLRFSMDVWSGPDGKPITSPETREFIKANYIRRDITDEKRRDELVDEFLKYAVNLPGGTPNALINLLVSPITWTQVNPKVAEIHADASRTQRIVAGIAKDAVEGIKSLMRGLSDKRLKEAFSLLVVVADYHGIDTSVAPGSPKLRELAQGVAQRLGLKSHQVERLINLYSQYRRSYDLLLKIELAVNMSRILGVETGRVVNIFKKHKIFERPGLEAINIRFRKQEPVQLSLPEVFNDLWDAVREELEASLPRGYAADMRDRITIHSATLGLIRAAVNAWNKTARLIDRGYIYRYSWWKDKAEAAVSVRVSPDWGWLRGLRTTNPEALRIIRSHITQALRMNKLPNIRLWGDLDTALENVAVMLTNMVKQPNSPLKSEDIEEALNSIRKGNQRYEFEFPLELPGGQTIKVPIVLRVSFVKPQTWSIRREQFNRIIRALVGFEPSVKSQLNAQLAQLRLESEARQNIESAAKILEEILEQQDIPLEEEEYEQLVDAYWVLKDLQDGQFFSSSTAVNHFISLLASALGISTPRSNALGYLGDYNPALYTTTEPSEEAKKIIEGYPLEAAVAHAEKLIDTIEHTSLVYYVVRHLAKLREKGITPPPQFVNLAVALVDRSRSPLPTEYHWFTRGLSWAMHGATFLYLAPNIASFMRNVLVDLPLQIVATFDGQGGILRAVNSLVSALTTSKPRKEDEAVRMVARIYSTEEHMLTPHVYETIARLASQSLGSKVERAYRIGLILTRVADAAGRKAAALLYVASLSRSLPYEKWAASRPPGERSLEAYAMWLAEEGARYSEVTFGRFGESWQPQFVKFLARHPITSTYLMFQLPRMPFISVMLLNLHVLGRAMLGHGVPKHLVRRALSQILATVITSLLVGGIRSVEIIGWSLVMLDWIAGLLSSEPRNLPTVMRGVAKVSDEMIKLLEGVVPAPEAIVDILNRGIIAKLTNIDLTRRADPIEFFDNALLELARNLGGAVVEGRDFLFELFRSNYIGRTLMRLYEAMRPLPLSLGGKVMGEEARRPGYILGIESTAYRSLQANSLLTPEGKRRQILQLITAARLSVDDETMKWLVEKLEKNAIRLAKAAEFYATRSEIAHIMDDLEERAIKLAREDPRVANRIIERVTQEGLQLPQASSSRQLNIESFIRSLFGMYRRRIAALAALHEFLGDDLYAYLGRSDFATEAVALISGYKKKKLSRNEVREQLIDLVFRGVMRSLVGREGGGLGRRTFTMPYVRPYKRIYKRPFAGRGEEELVEEVVARTQRETRDEEEEQGGEFMGEGGFETEEVGETEE